MFVIPLYILLKTYRTCLVFANIWFCGTFVKIIRGNKQLTRGYGEGCGVGRLRGRDNAGRATEYVSDTVTFHSCLEPRVLP